MELVKFPNLNNALEQQITEGVYSFYDVKEPIHSDFLKEFAQGLMGLCRKYDYLLSERGYTSKDLSDEDVALKLFKEDLKFEEQGDGDLLEFTEVELKTRPISAMEYSSNVNLFIKVLTRMKGVKELSLDDLKEMILDKPSRVKYLPDPDMDIDPKLGEYIGFLSFSSKSDAYNAGLEFSSVSNVVALYQECQVLQSGKKEDLDSIIWNVFSDETDIYIDDPKEGIWFTGLRALRVPALIGSEERNGSKRGFFDRIRCYGSRDAYRQFIAKSLGIFEEDEPIVSVNGGLEMTCFDMHYDSLDKESQKTIDREEDIQLRKLVLRYQLNGNYPLKIVERPFEIRPLANHEGHELIY